MNDALAVRGIQRIGDLHGQWKQSLQIERAPSNTVLQRHAFQVLHRNEREATIFTDVVDRADIRMVERRCRLRLSLKSRQRLRISTNFVRQELQRNEAVQARVLRLIDDAHAAAAQHLHDPIMRYSPSDHLVGNVHLPKITVNEQGRNSRRHLLLFTAREKRNGHPDEVPVSNPWPEESYALAPAAAGSASLEDFSSPFAFCGCCGCPPLRISMPPLKNAPSSIEIRAAITSPVSHPSLRISTRSLAVRLPRTLPSTTISRALMFAATTPLRPTVTRFPDKLMEPSTRPSI